MSRDCGFPTEQRLLTYYRQLLDLLGDKPTNPDTSFNSFSIRLHEGVAEARLQRYRWNSSIPDGPDVTFEISTDLRSPQSVLRLIREQLEPHTLRVRTYMNQFYELTQCSIAIEIDDPRLLSDPVLLLRSIEDTFKQMIDSIASMPEATRRAGVQGNPHVFTLLEPGLFGSRDAMRDVKDSPQTLQMLFDQKRTKAQR